MAEVCGVSAAGRPEPVPAWGAWLRHFAISAEGERSPSSLSRHFALLSVLAPLSPRFRICFENFGRAFVWISGDSTRCLVVGARCPNRGLMRPTLSNARPSALAQSKTFLLFPPLRPLLLALAPVPWSGVWGRPLFFCALFPSFSSPLLVEGQLGARFANCGRLARRRFGSSLRPCSNEHKQFQQVPGKRATYRQLRKTTTF